MVLFGLLYSAHVYICYQIKIGDTQLQMDFPEISVN